MHRRVAASRSLAQSRLSAKRAHTTLSHSSESSASSSSIPPIPPKTPTKSSVASSSKKRDPFAPVASHLASLRTSLLDLLGSGHPALPEVTQYYFLHPSKQVRPLIVLLMARATNGLGSGWRGKVADAERGRGVVGSGSGGRKDKERKAAEMMDWELDMHALDHPLGRSDVLNDWNPLLPAQTAPFTPEWDVHVPPAPTPTTPSTTPASPSPPALANILLPTQARLAQIVEMMHTASLLHDDVIDGSPLRRGSPSAPAAFTPKLAVLGGNFVLGRASVALARLGESEATELIAGVLANLVEGEILQLREVKVAAECAHSARDVLSTEGGADAEKRREAWNVYLQKTYLKTASLMAKGARASVVLGGCQDTDGVRTSEGHVKGQTGQTGERHVVWKDVAYAYGRNLGIAFQLVDDVLDYEADGPPPSSTTVAAPACTTNALGKPGGADLGLGLATGPALYAWEEHPGMGVLIGRGFKGDGDIEAARAMVYASSGVQRTRELAQEYANAAVDVLRVLPPSVARDALEGLARLVIGRKS